MGEAGWARYVALRFIRLNLPNATPPSGSSQANTAEAQYFIIPMSSCMLEIALSSALDVESVLRRDSEEEVN